MALNDFKPQFDNSYQEVFLKTLVAEKVMNTRFKAQLKYGESIERIAYDISGVVVRTVTRGEASIIDSVTDSSELLNINLEKEAVFHISDGEATQAGPLNPGEVIGGKIGRKVAIDLDGRCFAEVLNASYDFDNGDLTTQTSTGTPITLSNTTVPQMITRMNAKLASRNNIQTDSNMILVVDAYAASDIEQYLLSKNIDLAGYVFRNGYAGDVKGAKMYVSENLTGEALLTSTGVFVDTQTIVINGVTFTSMTTLGATAGNFLIGANAAASLTNLAALINNPGTTSATQVALSAADQAAMTGISAVATATTLQVIGTGTGRLIVTETQTNVALTTNVLHAYYGKQGAIDLVIQDMNETEMLRTSDRRGTNVFSSYLAGIKTFADGAKQFLDVLIQA